MSDSDARAKPALPNGNFQAVLVRGARTEIAAFGFVDRHVVDAGFAARHQSRRAEFPQLVAVAAIPLTGVIMALVLKPHGDAVVVKIPQALAQRVVEFALPLAGKKRDDLVPADDVLAAVSPF